MIEFIQLDGSEAREVDPLGTKWPDGTLVLYAVEQGEIVGRQAYLLLPHLEGSWVREDKRSSTIGYRLVKKMEEAVKESGYPVVFAYALDASPEVGEYLERMEYEKLPLSIYMKNVEHEQEKEASA